MPTGHQRLILGAKRFFPILFTMTYIALISPVSALTPPVVAAPAPNSPVYIAGDIPPSAPAFTPTGRVRVRSWEELRWEGVVRQWDEHSCGPAAVSTVLQLLFGQDMIPGEESLFQSDKAATLRDLQIILGRYSVPTIGMQMTLPDLERYLNDFHQPVIAHILMPDPHFTVVVGSHLGYILTRDPALGRISWEKKDWEAVWSGIALLIAIPATPGKASGQRHDDNPAPDDFEDLIAKLRLLYRPHYGYLGSY